jgi:hypothetical protein
MEGATYANAETLINHWLAVALGALLELVERQLDRAFGLTRNEYVELDTTVLLRSDLPARIEALSKGILGGLYTPNEARALEGLDPKASGNEPMLQAQMTPLSYLGKIAELAATPPKPPPAPLALPPPGPVKSFDAVRAAALVRAMLERGAHV